MDRLQVGREYSSHLTDADLTLLALVAGPSAGTGQVSERPDRRAPRRCAATRRSCCGWWSIRMRSGPSSARARPPAGGRLGRRPSWCSRYSCSGPPPSWPRWVTCRSARTAPAGAVVRRARAAGLPQRACGLALPGRAARFVHPGGQRPLPGPGGRQERTRRFSELDPVRMAGLLEAVPQAERPGVYRRLGDVALFLTGVFPDYATTRALGPVNAARLLRAAQPAGAASRNDSPARQPSSCWNISLAVYCSRPRSRTGGHGAGRGGRRRGRPVPAGTARAQPSRRRVPAALPSNPGSTQPGL